MDEQMMGQDSGVNEAGAADQQVENQENIESGQETTQTGVETGQAAAAVETDRTEQAFARRLAAERQKIEGQFTPYRQLVERVAAQHKMTPEQYVETIARQMDNQERKEFQERYNMTPEQFQGMVDRHPVVRQAKQFLTVQQRNEARQAEIDDFVELFPGVTEIPPEVIKLKEERGLSLADAYWRVTHRKEINQAKNQGEQEAIRKLQRNAQSSPGPLGGGGADAGAGSVGKMPQKDFDSLVESVLRGERKNL